MTEHRADVTWTTTALTNVDIDQVVAIMVVQDAIISEDLAICKVICIGKMRGSSRAMVHMAWARQGMKGPLGI